MKKYLPNFFLKILRKLRARYKKRSIVHGLKLRIRNLKSGKKIIYALIPTPQLANIGDQAQVVAIELWLKKHFPDHAVLEVNKDETIYGQRLLNEFIKQDDLIFLHSGGNLGDRGIWSETGRRLMIQNFLQNRIISLPQTIFFSDTDEGRKQKVISQKIYAGHPNLTIIGRDKESGRLAERLFPTAQVLVVPDFVLSLTLDDLGICNITPKSGKILACLRVDDESVLTAEGRKNIAKSLGEKTTLIDTTLSEPINAENRIAFIRQFVSTVLEHEAVVTDRFHGLIFSVIAKRPAVVLQTVDHKLTSAMDWFNTTSFVIFSPSVNQIDQKLQQVLSDNLRECPDFRAEYFDNLPDRLGLL
jgi:pyruvyl transferase EpsI